MMKYNVTVTITCMTVQILSPIHRSISLDKARHNHIRSNSPSSSCTTNSMNIVLNMCREVIIDNIPASMCVYHVTQLRFSNRNHVDLCIHILVCTSTSPTLHVECWWCHKNTISLLESKCLSWKRKHVRKWAKWYYMNGLAVTACMISNNLLPSGKRGNRSC